MNVKILIHISLIARLSSSCSVEEKSSLKEAWNRTNKPEHMSDKYFRKLDLLPKSGSVLKPWSGDYWPSYKGGISYRWNARSLSFKDKVAYKIPSIKQLETTNISKLSPSEKYDLYMEDMNFSVTKAERKRTNILESIKGSSSYIEDFEIASWEGLCHAWAPATKHFEQPHRVKLKSLKANHEIDFSSSDVKALLSYAIDRMPHQETYFMGSRCNTNFKLLKDALIDGDISQEEFRREKSTTDCKDVNAGSFHIVLANLIGIDNESFIIDKTRDSEVWNQAVYNYSTSYREASLDSYKTKAWNTKRLLKVDTQISYIVEVAPSRDATFSDESIETVNYEYYLELDANDRIIGGKWISKNYPDFIWKISKPVFTAEFKHIENIYKASLIENQLDSSLVTNEIEAIEMVYILDKALAKFKKRRKHYENILKAGFIGKKLNELKARRSKLLLALEKRSNIIDNFKKRNELREIRKIVSRFEALQKKFRGERSKTLQKIRWLKEEEEYLLSFIE